MEASTKERLTGALIFVAAVIVIVPEMFSGPEPQAAGSTSAAVEPAEAGPPLRTYSMTLNDSAESRAAAPVVSVPAAPPAERSIPPQAAAEPQPEAKPQPVAKPEPVAKAQPGAEPQSIATAPVAKPAAATSASAAPEPVNSSASGNWWLRIGLFASRDNAERLVKKLHAAGYSVELDKQSVGGKQMFRVRAGPARDRAEAQALQARLKASGTDSLLLAP